MAYLILGGILLLYCSSWWLHPMRACPKCKGSSRHHGSVHRTKYRFCDKCQGKGRQPRMGARVLMGMGLIKDPERTGSLRWNRLNRNR